MEKINLNNKKNPLPKGSEYSDKLSTKSKIIQMNVIISYSYSSESHEYNNISIKLLNSNTFSLNELLDELIHKGLDFTNTAISYFDEDLKTYLLCGKFPFTNIVTIPYDGSDTPTIKLRSRLIIKKENLMRMELSEEAPEMGDENNQNMFINVKSKRSKERKIGFIIEKVFLWRKLYNGYIDENGEQLKMTLEEAADKVGISKKSLDDYLIQLRY